VKSNLVDISCHIADEREKAVAIADGTMEKLDDGREREKWFWLPRSQIEIDTSGKQPVVTMPEWLAKDKGLI